MSQELIKSFPGALVPIQTQLETLPENTPFTFINTVVLPSADDEQPFLAQWAKGARQMKSSDGLISAQMYRGCPDEKNHVFVLVVVWESVGAFQAAFNKTEFQDKLSGFPDGTRKFHLMATKIAVQGVCTT